MAIGHNFTNKLERLHPTETKKMDVEKAFHMTGGVGKTSYAKNSSLQVLSFFPSLIYIHYFLVPATIEFSD